MAKTHHKNKADYLKYCSPYGHIYSVQWNDSRYVWILDSNTLEIRGLNAVEIESAKTTLGENIVYSDADTAPTVDRIEMVRLIVGTALYQSAKEKKEKLRLRTSPTENEKEIAETKVAERLTYLIEQKHDYASAKILAECYGVPEGEFIELVINLTTNGVRF